jgi:colicin import membrane protein
VISFAWLGLPSWMIPEPDIKVIKVQLVTAKNVKQAPKKTEKKHTQQSAAPAQPKKKQKPKIKREPKHETKMVTPKDLKKKQVVKKEEPKKAQQKQEEENKAIARPEKLDKTKNKKTIVKDKNAEKKVAKVEDDFLKTLDFIKDLKQEDSKIAHKQDDVEDEPQTLTSEDYTSIAILKKHIEKNWFRPPGIKDLDKLSIQIEVEINRDGTIEDLQLVKSSGQQFFDNSLLRAVRKSVPLPLPGERYNVFRIIELHFNG